MRIKLVYLCLFILMANLTFAQMPNDSTELSNNFFLIPQPNFWFLFLFISAFSAIGFCMYQLSKINKKIGGEAKIDTANPDLSRLSQGANTKLSLNKSDIEKLILDSDKISDINYAISNLQNRLSVVEGNSLNKNENQSTGSQTIQEEVFYMMKPVDGYFLDSNKSYSKNETVYKFTVKPNKTVAVFEIHTGGAPVNDIAIRNEVYLKPACEEENIPGSKVSNIITKSKGIALLEGDKWVVKTKAVISYE